MEYVIIVFRSRSNTVKISGLLTRNGISNEIINTPKEAQVGCGLSVKIRKEYFERVKKGLGGLVEGRGATYFLVKTVAGKRFIKSI